MSKRIFVGTLPVAALADDRISSGDYPDWRYTDHYIRQESKYDRGILDELLRSIPENGVEEPLTLGVDHRHREVFLSDGHHRAVALRTLGVRDFPYRWYYHPRPGRMIFAKEPLPEWTEEVIGSV